MSDDLSPFAPPSAPSQQPEGSRDDIDTARPPPHVWRWVAYMIDFVAVVAPVLLMVMVPVVLLEVELTEERIDLGTNLVLAPLFVLASGLYHAVFESSAWQASPGKMLMGLKVVRDDGGRLGLGQALGRGLARALLLQLCGFLSLSVFFDAQHRGVWGSISRSRVIRAHGEMIQDDLSM